MLGTLLITLGSSLTSAGGQDVLSSCELPEVYVAGQPYMVSLVYEGGAEGVSLEAWRVGPGALEVDGKPLADRKHKSPIALPKGSSMKLELDISEYIKAEGSFTPERCGRR